MKGEPLKGLGTRHRVSDGTMYSGMIPVYNRCRGYNFRLRGGEFLWLTLTVGYRYAKLVSASQYSGIAM